MPHARHLHQDRPPCLPTRALPASALAWHNCQGASGKSPRRGTSFRFCFAVQQHGRIFSGTRFLLLQTESGRRRQRSHTQVAKLGMGPLGRWKPEVSLPRASPMETGRSAPGGRNGPRPAPGSTSPTSSGRAPDRAACGHAPIGTSYRVCHIYMVELWGWVNGVYAWPHVIATRRPWSIHSATRTPSLRRIRPQSRWPRMAVEVMSGSPTEHKNTAGTVFMVMDLFTLMLMR